MHVDYVFIITQSLKNVRRSRNCEIRLFSRFQRQSCFEYFTSSQSTGDSSLTSWSELSHCWNANKQSKLKPHQMRTMRPQRGSDLVNKVTRGSLVEYSLKGKGIIRKCLTLFSNCVALINIAVLFQNLLLGKICDIYEVSQFSLNAVTTPFIHASYATKGWILLHVFVGVLKIFLSKNIFM